MEFQVEQQNPMTFNINYHYICSLKIDNLLFSQIALISNKQFVDTFGCISINFLKPLLDIVEGFLISNIINDNNAMSSAIVRGSDGSESFLSCGIPLKKEFQSFCNLTICNLTVFPSSSIVRIFYRYRQIRFLTKSTPIVLM